jgi:hypothetical protein
MTSRSNWPRRGPKTQSSIMNDEQARKLRERYEETKQQPEKPMEWEYCRFGLRWNTSVDLMSVPDTAGVFVVFFDQKRKIVGAASNLFRQLQQHWFAPGPRVLAFSWLEIFPPEAREYVRQSIQTRSYEQLWEDIRPTGGLHRPSN